MWSLSLSFALLVANFARSDLFTEWERFKEVHQKEYSQEEDLYRQGVFFTNLRRIAKLNQDARGRAKFAVNKFAAMTPSEFKEMLTFVPHEYIAAPLFDPKTPTFARGATIDWRTKGAITDVKDQGQCGSCWAFSAVEETESMWILKGKSKVELSVQQVVSCDSVDGACNGGDTPTAYAYIQSAGGLESEDDYPYSSGGGDNGTCNFDKSKLAGGNNNGFVYASPACQSNDPDCRKVDEAKLLQSLGTAPISICVVADPWQFYDSGVMTHDQCDGKFADLDHCVQLVGYNADPSDGKYWIVRNSWGSDWGESGYIWLEYGFNTCGVADEATIPKIVV